jgi:hypothetical protein
MTNIYAVKVKLHGATTEVILNALNQGEAIRKAEDFFARKFDTPAATCSCKALASIVIHGLEHEMVPGDSRSQAATHGFALPRPATT